MAINCCRYCVAPKRHPGCHGKCSECLDEKAEHDALKAAEDKKRRIEYGLDAQLIKSARRTNMINHKKG